MSGLVRVIGQSPILPGAVVGNGMVYTSGIVAPATMAGLADGTRIPAARQVAEAVDYLLDVLDRAGSSPDRVLKVESFLSTSELMPVWNEVFLRVWPVPGPARTTVVVGFTSPLIDFELHAVALA
jgi:2-iminobutanoate/2-iminopropanoate deaminase